MRSAVAGLTSIGPRGVWRTYDPSHTKLRIIADVLRPKRTHCEDQPHCTRPSRRQNRDKRALKGSDMLIKANRIQSPSHYPCGRRTTSRVLAH